MGGPPLGRLACLLLLPALACSREAPRPADPAGREQARLRDSRCEEVDAQDRCTLYGVSLIELIARPEEFDGRRVRVIGFVRLEFEGNGIYVSREDWEHSISRNGLWIEPPENVLRQDFQPRYMLVEGRFDAANHGHLGMWSGAIVEVTRFEPWARFPPKPAATNEPAGSR
jgi:hypothetical protein